MSEKIRVVVTGMAVCSPLGLTVDSFWNNSLSGQSGVDRIENFSVNPGYSNVAGMVKGFHPETLFSVVGKGVPEDRVFLFADYCIGLALQDAGIDEEERGETGLCLSSAIGQMSLMESHFTKNPGQRERLAAFSFNSLAGRLATKHGLKGGHMIIPTGCVGGCDSVSYGFHNVRNGVCRRIVVGASEAPITPLVIAAFGRIGATSVRECPPAEASCPFDSERDGFAIAEGAAILVLESEASALARGCAILAEIKGSGSVNSGYHMTDLHPSGDAIAASCGLALADAGLKPGDIDFINAHGSSTPQNDNAESAAIVGLFGRRTADIPVTSIKSQVGHALSAANAIELVSTIKAINTSMIPPTINLKRQDPSCPISVVGNHCASHRIRHSLKISSGFSGIHTAVVVSHYG